MYLFTVYCINSIDCPGVIVFDKGSEGWGGVGWGEGSGGGKCLNFKCSKSTLPNTSNKQY